MASLGILWREGPGCSEQGRAGQGQGSSSLASSLCLGTDRAATACLICCHREKFNKPWSALCWECASTKALLPPCHLPGLPCSQESLQRGMAKSWGQGEHLDLSPNSHLFPPFPCSLLALPLPMTHQAPPARSKRPGEPRLTGSAKINWAEIS